MVNKLEVVVAMQFLFEQMGVFNHAPELEQYFLMCPSTHNYFKLLSLSICGGSSGDRLPAGAAVIVNCKVNFSLKFHSNYHKSTRTCTALWLMDDYEDTGRDRKTSLEQRKSSCKLLLLF